MRLHGGTERDDFVGIELGVRHFAAGAEMEDVVGEAADQGDTRRTTDENDFVDLLGGDGGVFEGLQAGTEGAVNDRLDDLLELLAGDFAPVGLAIRKVETDAGRALGRECDLRFDDRFANGLDSFSVSWAKSCWAAASERTRRSWMR